MLYLSLIVSAVLLKLANGLAKRSKQPVISVACLGLGCTLVPGCVGFGLPAVALQAIFLCLAVLLWREPGREPRSFLKLMDRTRKVPTRPLDRFEAFSLDSLRRGEDMVVARDDDGLRMLGSIRSLTQCVASHGGDRGVLLGAFSYVLRPELP